MTRPLAAAAFAVMLTLLPAAAATAEQAAPTLLRVGDTGIRCKRAPCPWRGVVPVNDAGGAGAADPAYVGEAPPVIAAPPELLDRAQAEIRRAWATGGCLMVLGRFERRGAAATPILSVERIEGPCDQ
ncbi:MULTISPECIES: hypothetical protein [Inquilinus]|uniref:DUF4156 domain-containing protein n=1 Tax=Inquilinus ginsengisoli TaxID=363840 RepID=A0ABU1JI11_9PROT|nr:hypothetical protein [Inquilinus ginsengisoli]MDR6287699.1 hypothetical protein [Inquilinus ginsengisoli]